MTCVLVPSPVVRHRVRFISQIPHRASRTANDFNLIEVESPSIHHQAREDAMQNASNHSNRSEEQAPGVDVENAGHDSDDQYDRLQLPSVKNPKKARHSVVSIESRNDPTPEQYLDRISVCGVHNYLYASSALERRFWIFIFILATGGTLSYLVPAFQQYLSFTTVWDIQYQTQPNMKIPNPYVCVWAMNSSRFRAKFETVKTQLYEDKRLIFLGQRIGRLLAKRDPVHWSNRSYDSVSLLESTMNYMTAGVAGDTEWIDDIHHENLDEALAKTIEYLGTNYDGVRVYYDEGMFGCNSVLRNCTVNGKLIDCCRDSAIGIMVMANKCFKFDLRRELKELNFTMSDRTVLSFETIMDSDLVPSNDILYKGPMEISLGLQNHAPNGFDASDVTLAVGTTSLVTVNGKLKRSMFGCIEKYQYNPIVHSEVHPLVQEYFKNMTQTGRYNVEECGQMKMVEKLSIECGCVPYFKEIHPDDSIICSTSQIYACMHAATQPSDDESDPESISSKIDVWRNLKQAIDKECVPLCETWSYDAVVSSLDAEGDAGNISQFYRSKITIAFDPEYVVEEEVMQMDYHALIATIGDDLGLIFGMSFITFVQIAYWTVEAIRIRRRFGRVNVAR